MRYISNAVQWLYLAMILLLVPSCNDRHSHPSDIDSLLTELDNAIAHRQEYAEKKESLLDSLRQVYKKAANDAERFQALGNLFDEYRSYNADSSMVMCQRRLDLAEETGNPEYIMHARLNIADQLMFTNMYAEALEVVEPLTSADVPDYLKSYLFHIKRTTYGLLCDYSLAPEYKNRYRELTDVYRDSILSVNDPKSLTWHIVRSDQLNSNGKAQEAIANLTGFLNRSGVNGIHDTAISAYTLADSYHQLGDTINEKRMLIKSAIYDITAPVKEYIALRRLALMLHQEGDIDHAYKYLNICMADAQECNARQRIIEIHSIYPVVSEMYMKTIANQQKRLFSIMIVVAVLAVLLLVSVIMIRKQMRKVTNAHDKQRKLTAELKELNGKLRDYNEQLVEANRSIAENSGLKEAYIAKYMDQCLDYIFKLDSYRKSLHKLVMADRMEDLKSQTKSLAFINSELDAFYANFDSTFLRLFPTFIEDFNSLLKEDERIYPKQEGQLTTELRIFALIRLGISDSTKIARFLNYSTTTIYNYRTRVRNRAVGDRDKLETELMKFGGSKAWDSYADKQIIVTTELNATIY